MDRIRQTSRQLTRLLDDAFRPLGLRYTQYIILSMVLRCPHRNLPFLARELATDRTTLHRVLVPLIKGGYLTRLHDSEMWTNWAVDLTEAGVAKALEGQQVWEALGNQIQSGFGQQDYDQLLESLGRFTEMLSQLRRSNLRRLTREHREQQQAKPKQR